MKTCHSRGQLKEKKVQPPYPMRGSCCCASFVASTLAPRAPSPAKGMHWTTLQKKSPINYLRKWGSSAKCGNPGLGSRIIPVSHYCSLLSGVWIDHVIDQFWQPLWQSNYSCTGLMVPATCRPLLWDSGCAVAVQWPNRWRKFSKIDPNPSLL